MEREDEIRAMKSMTATLEKLSYSAQERVFKYVESFYQESRQKQAPTPEPTK